MANDTADTSVNFREPARFGSQVYVDGALAVDGAVSFHAPGGSPLVSQRGTMIYSDGAAAGVHTVSLTVPAGALLVDVIVHCVALWNQGTSAALIVGDDTDPNGIFDAVDLKATNLLAGESIAMSAGHGNLPGAYIVGTLPTGHWESRYQAAARTVDFELTTVGTAATTGQIVCEIIYSLPSSNNTVASTYVAS